MGQALKQGKRSTNPLDDGGLLNLLVLGGTGWKGESIVERPTIWPSAAMEPPRPSAINRLLSCYVRTATEDFFRHQVARAPAGSRLCFERIPFQPERPTGQGQAKERIILRR